MITNAITALSPLALLVLKATLVMAVIHAAVSLMRNASASTRHAFLALLFVFLLLLPFGSALLPRVGIEVADARPDTPIPTAVTAASAVVAPVTVAPASSTTVGTSLPSLQNLAAIAYVSGVVFVVLRLLIGMARLGRIRRDGLLWVERVPELTDLARSAGIHRPIHLLRSSDVITPMTYGLIDPVIIVPAEAAEWQAEDLTRALTHEVEHIRRADWLVQKIATLACALYWFHPLAWAAARRLSLEAERACDDAVLRSDAVPAGYAEQLVALARRITTSGNRAAVAMAGRSLLHARVHSILDGSRRRESLSAVRVTAAAGVTVVALFIFAPLQAVPAAGPFPSDEEVNSDVGESEILEEAMVQAAGDGDIATVDRLLGIGVSPDAVVRGDGSPLIAAARRGHLDLVRHLLARGATIDLAVEGDGNPLIMASGAGHLETVRFLLDNGADIEAVTVSDENALIQASWNGHEEIVRLLLSRGADPNVRVGVRTALRMARRSGHSDIVHLLVSAGATN